MAITTSIQLKNGFIDTMNIHNMNAYFAMITHTPELSSAAIVNEHGYEFDITPVKGGFDNREVYMDSLGGHELWRRILKDSTSNQWNIAKEWKNDIQQDPRTRDFYTGLLLFQKEKYIGLSLMYLIQLKKLECLQHFNFQDYPLKDHTFYH